MMVVNGTLHHLEPVRRVMIGVNEGLYHGANLCLGLASVRGNGLNLRDHSAHRLLKQGLIQGLLAVVVVIDEGLGRTGLLGNLPNRGAVKTTLGKQCFGNRPNLGAVVRGRRGFDGTGHNGH